MPRLPLVLATIILSLASTVACAEEKARPIEIMSKSLPLAYADRDARTLGKLHHLGTLKLTSPDSDFGGLSGLIVSPDGTRFLAITDASHWLTGELAYDKGRLSGIKGTRIAPLRDEDGKPLSGKQGDAEGLAGTLDGTIYVSFEGDHRIWAYAFGRDGLDAAARAVPVPEGLAKAPGNGGLEALELLRNGRLLALTEGLTDKAGQTRGWLIDPQGGKDEALSIVARAPYEITDARQLPGGDVLTLERRFSRTGGIGFAMRRFPLGSLEQGSPIRGEVIAEAGMDYVIDNMEGLSVRTDEGGRTLVYALSDDNFNGPLQQTLLMLFELRD
jgi:hypothetical protein